MIRRSTFLVCLVLWNLACLVAFACGQGHGRCPEQPARVTAAPPPERERTAPDCPTVPPAQARFQSMRGYCDPDQNALCNPLNALDERELWRRLGDYELAFEGCAAWCRRAQGER